MLKLFIWVILFLSSRLILESSTHDVQEQSLLNQYAFFQRYLAEYMQPAEKKVTIQDWKNPSLKDYQALQNYLKTAPRPELDLLVIGKMQERKKRMREFTLVENELPIFKIIPINEIASEKDCCIITYISFNRYYYQGLETIIESLKKNGFKGDVIYHIGGWPNVCNGCLEHFDVPYAFKVCALLEAKNLGYKKCLWMDASVVPLQSLDPVFDHIEKKGICFFFWKNSKAHLNVCSQFIAKKLHVSLSELHAMRPVTATVFGFNFDNVKAEYLLDKWHALVKNKLGFLTFAPEEVPFSILIHQNGFLDCEGDPKFFQICQKEISKETIFFVDWFSVGLKKEKQECNYQRLGLGPGN